MTNAGRSQGSYEEYDREGFLYTGIFGGLNTESSPNNLALGESPSLLNMEVTPNGTIRKRRGTHLRIKDTATNTRAGKGAIQLIHTLKNSDLILISKRETTLAFYVLNRESAAPSAVTEYGGTNTGAVLVAFYPAVFSTRVADLRPSWVITPDDIPRLLIASGENTVVQVDLLEQQVTFTTDKTGTLTITDDLLPYVRFVQTSGLAMVIINNTTGAVTTVTSSSAVGNVVTINYAGTLLAGSYTLFRPVWHYWVESQRYSPENLYDMLVQPATSASPFPQPALLIPENLRRNLGTARFNVNGDNPYTIYTNTSSPPTLMAFDQTPGASDTEVAYSDGTGSQIVGDLVQSGETHIVSGRAGAGATVARFLHMVRFHALNVNNGLGLPAVTVAAVFNYFGGSQSFITANLAANFTPSTATDDWYTLAERQYKGADSVFTPVASSTATLIRYVAMCGSIPFGCHAGSMTFINRTRLGQASHNHIGTNEVTIVDQYAGLTTVNQPDQADLLAVGRALAVAGLWETCRFTPETYDFPSIINYFQGRVVLAGFRSAPTLLHFSNITTNYEWEISNYYRDVNNNFQTFDSDPLLSFNPLQVQLDVSSSENITALLPVNDVLVVFTNQSVVVISGVNDSNIAPTSFKQNRVANIGCVNKHSVVNTEYGIVFLSYYGVYLLRAIDNRASYEAINLSLNVSSLMEVGQRFNEDVAYMTYNQLRSEVYLGVSDGKHDTSCTRLLVLNLQRSSWSEYALPNGYWHSTYATTIKNRVFINNIFYESLAVPVETTTTRVDLLELSDTQYFLDYVVSMPGTAFVAGTDSPHARGTDYLTADTAQTNYKLGASSALFSSYYGFRSIPIRQVADYTLINTTSSTTLLDFGAWESGGYTGTLQVDKTPNGSFVIDNHTYSTGNTFRCRQTKIGSEEFPIHVYVNNVELPQSGTPSFSCTDLVGDTYYQLTPTATYTVNDSVIIGHAYPTYWFSPVFTRGRLDVGKKVTHAIVQFNNIYNSQFVAADRNVAASQAASAVADRYKTLINASTAVLFDSSFEGVYSTDTFNSTSLLFTFGTDLPKTRRSQFSNVTLPFVGTNAKVQLALYSFDNTFFEVSAYQLLTEPLGKSYRNYQDLS